MAWPTAQDYSEAVQNPRLNFQDAELKTGQVELNQLGLPRPRSGNFATVYRMRCGQRHWAVRCFLRNVTDQQERYATISEYFARIKRLGRIQLPYMVDFEFLEKGIKVNGQWYPILKMEWVEGELLDKFIEKQLPNSTTLRHLAERWVTMTQTLENAGIAHGDLQHGNILIVKGELKLIDYDGMFVSTLFGFSSNEVGHYNYQHPSRNGDDFRADIDRFSAWVIYIALIALSIEPNLWQRVGAGDEFILLRKEDFVKPDTSATLALLTQHNDALIQSLVIGFKQLLRNPAQIPPLEQQKVIVSTTHTSSTSSDWLTDYLPQKQQKSSPSVQSPPTSFKPAYHSVKPQTIRQSPPISFKPASPPVKQKTRGKKWLTSKLVFVGSLIIGLLKLALVGLLIVGLLIVGMSFLISEMEKRELTENLRICETHFQANRLTNSRGGTALACYENILKKYPTNPEALAGLDKIEALIKQALDRIDKAEQNLARLRQLDTESHWLAKLTFAEQLRECEEYFQGNRLKISEDRTDLECYKTILVNDPINAKALEGLRKIEERLATLRKSALEKRQRKQVEREAKLRECEEHFQANRLTKGQKGTALECYKKVLLNAPTNAKALEGLRKIEERLVTLIKRALKKGQRKKADKYLTSLRNMNLESPMLAELPLAEQLRECDKHFQANRLTTGKGGTALACYQAILKKEPNNTQALTGLKNIEARYVEWAEGALDKGEQNKAKQYLVSLRQVNPQSSQLAELEARLSTLSSSNR
ncbi:MAG: hypothetical protein DRR16_22910 [Candidatus Parabeggiatoa sp. nov. 3]|nr:MAG: hypothetical protein DRR00_03830 [Gammaproteobacteria bacterium]RKZ80986.1 MAG: hypothetical protein DRR16_22910 [Gammaproteobacteria bacterium]